MAAQVGLAASAKRGGSSGTVMSVAGRDKETTAVGMLLNVGAPLSLAGGGVWSEKGLGQKRPVFFWTGAQRKKMLMVRSKRNRK